LIKQFFIEDPVTKRLKDRFNKDEDFYQRIYKYSSQKEIILKVRLY